MIGERSWREYQRSPNLAKTAMIALILMLPVASLIPAAYAKDKTDDFTKVYTHTYDEVFQAAQNAAEREGWFVTNKDKDKGVIWVQYSSTKPSHSFEMHIETLSAKPETKVTICCFKTRQSFPRVIAGEMFSELQKVLATYGQ